MQTINDIYNFITTHKTEIIGVYTAIISTGWITSELLAQIPSIEANSVFQVIYKMFQKIYGYLNKQ
jgi:transcription initiation factor IIE alpha subunit